MLKKRLRFNRDARFDHFSGYPFGGLSQGLQQGQRRRKTPMYASFNWYCKTRVPQVSVLII
jgi:hypothetical protein